MRAHELWHCCSPLPLPGTDQRGDLPLLISAHCSQEQSDSTVMKTSTCTGRSQWTWLVAKDGWEQWTERPGHAAVALSSLLQTKVHTEKSPGQVLEKLPPPSPPSLHPQSSCCSRMRLDVIPEPGTMWEGAWEGTRSGPGRERGENPPSTMKLGGATHQGPELKRARGEREGTSDSSRPHQCVKR